MGERKLNGANRAGRAGEAAGSDHDSGPGPNRTTRSRQRRGIGVRSRFRTMAEPHDEVEASGSDDDSGRGPNRTTRSRHRGQITIQDDGLAGGRGLVRNRALTPMTGRPEKELRLLQHRNRGRSGISYTTERSGNSIVLNSDPTPIARWPAVHDRTTGESSGSDHDSGRGPNRTTRSRHRGQITIQDDGLAGGRGLVRNRALTPMTGWPEKALPPANSQSGSERNFVRHRALRRQHRPEFRSDPNCSVAGGARSHDRRVIGVRSRFRTGAEPHDEVEASGSDHDSGRWSNRTTRSRQRGQITIQDDGPTGGRGLVRNRALTPMTGRVETDLHPPANTQSGSERNFVHHRALRQQHRPEFRSDPNCSVAGGARSHDRRGSGVR